MIDSSLQLQALRCDTALLPGLAPARLQLHILRLDLLHPVLGGNKGFKLRLNIDAALAQGHHTLLSFGGAYSNHLAALATAARLAGLRSIGLVRGELPRPLNPVLRHAAEQGMTLLSVTRSDYRRKTDPDFIASLERHWGPFHLIPEGGANRFGVAGCAAMAEHLPAEALAAGSTVAMACGTGGSLAGLLNGLARREARCRALGVAVLKGGDFLRPAVAGWLDTSGQVPLWDIDTRHDCGGYAKRSDALNKFINEFIEMNDIPVEPVYTGKLLYALRELARRDHFPEGARVTAIHTGGIW
ncbi:MAG: hypothetical protein RLZZ385_1958 [Pseudomonadota bacterium]|jgi:1-aminocyclopropane-1-carboxylate deaminase/D-cysteine desulfhydrase-like pyridoxal-dependent ACC family enzyme